MWLWWEETLLQAVEMLSQISGLGKIELGGERLPQHVPGPRF